MAYRACLALSTLALACGPLSAIGEGNDLLPDIPLGSQESNAGQGEVGRARLESAPQPAQPVAR